MGVDQLVTGGDVNDPVVDSIDADDAYNSAIADSVDYLDPRWLTRTDAVVFDTVFDSIDGWLQSTTGSATINNGVNGLSLDTRGTSGSTASFDTNFRDNLRAQPNYDRDRDLRIGVNILDSDNDRLDYITTGAPDNGNKGFGFKIIDDAGTAKLQGVVHNGTSENTVDLTTGFGTGLLDLHARFVAGTDVEFFVNGMSEGTISSGLPAGSEAIDEIVRIKTENTTGAGRRIRTHCATVVQMP